MRKVKPIFRLAKQAFDNLKANDPIRMAAATAFFAFFALPPIVIILSQLLSGLLNDRYQRVSSQLFGKLADLFGTQSARQLEDISRHLQQRTTSIGFTVLTVLLLLLASTTLFAIIKSSLNQLWNIKSGANRHFGHALTDRVVALSIIGFTGILFTASLALRQILSVVTDQLPLDSANYGWLGPAGHHIRSVIILTVWFAVVFKYLPDVRIQWRAVWVGGLVTGILVEIGENVLDRFLIHSSVSSLYGASGAIILILLFVFYSSLIFYFGASFTRQYAQWLHLDVEPGDNAVVYTIQEINEYPPEPEA